MFTWVDWSSVEAWERVEVPWSKDRGSGAEVALSLKRTVDV